MQWQDWFELCEETVWPYSLYGIYRVRSANSDGVPVPIPRIGGTDADGILNIGRSGYTTAKTDRSLGQRLWEFWYGRHSGAYTYYLTVQGLAQLPPFAGHKLWASIVVLPEVEIAQAEQSALHEYFQRFLELPPYNAAFPGR